jgi:CBS domain-containing protein
MKQFRISSILVTDADTGKFVGVLDIMDILIYIIYGNFFDQDLLVDMRSANQKLKEINAKEIIGAERQIQTGRWGNGLIELDGKMNLYDSLDVFASGEKRILADRKVCSQIDVVEFIGNHSNIHLKHVLKKPLCDTSLLNAEDQKFNYLCCVEENAITLSALRKMVTWKADAVAVTKDSKLISTLSASDIRQLVSVENGEVNVDFNALLLPLECFLKKINMDSMRAPIFVSKSEMLEEVMKKMVSNRIHRVWVVDQESETPISCLRVEDAIREFSALAH